MYTHCHTYIHIGISVYLLDLDSSVIGVLQSLHQVVTLPGIILIIKTHYWNLFKAASNNGFILPKKGIAHVDLGKKVINVDPWLVQL